MKSVKLLFLLMVCASIIIFFAYYIIYTKNGLDVDYNAIIKNVGKGDLLILLGFASYRFYTKFF